MNATSVSHVIDDDPLTSLVNRVRQTFTRRHRRPPLWIVAAPGRVNLMGEHIDYNDGFVLPMAINRYVAIAAGPSSEENPSQPVARFFSANLNQAIQIRLDKLPAPDPDHASWSSYVEGVLAGFLKKEYRFSAFDAVIMSTVPMGGGLSSSAALEVATATLLEAINGDTLEPVEKALLCRQAEHQFAGVPCGIMDQFSSVFGQDDALLLLDCQSRVIQPIPFPSQDISVLITNSHVKHELTGGEYATRREQCNSALKKLRFSSWRDATPKDLETSRPTLDDVENRRARHVVSEITRTVVAASVMRDGLWNAFGDLMYASHYSLRDDYEVSCEELDLLVDLAQEIGVKGGVLGSRMTGAGFGGCTVSLVKTDCVAEVSETLTSEYRRRTGINADVFASPPTRGAHRIG